MADFYQIKKHFKCSECGGIDNHEFITREKKTDTIKEQQTFIHCKNCQHETLVATTSISPPENEPKIYKSQSQKDLIEF